MIDSRSRATDPDADPARAAAGAASAAARFIHGTPTAAATRRMTFMVTGGGAEAVVRWEERWEEREGDVARGRGHHVEKSKPGSNARAPGTRSATLRVQPLSRVSLAVFPAQAFPEFERCESRRRCPLRTVVQKNADLFFIWTWREPMAREEVRPRDRA